MAYGTRRYRFAILTAGLQQDRVPVVNLCRSELLQGSCAKVWDNLPLGKLPITLSSL
jgi:hypothetical protein